MATLLSCFVAFAQAKKEKPVKKEKQKEEDSLNKTDGKNRKQGTWFYKFEALRGEPAYAEFGNYKDDLRVGLWYKLDSEQRLMSIENYSRGVLNGTAQYYENGKLICIGTYRGLNPDVKFDSIWVTDPVTEYQELVAVPSEKGTMKHGLWRYYDPETGQMVKEEEYQVDDLIGKREFHFVSKSDSIRVERRNANLPHTKKRTYKPPAGKVKSYTY